MISCFIVFLHTWVGQPAPFHSRFVASLTDIHGPIRHLRMGIEFIEGLSFTTLNAWFHQRHSGANGIWSSIAGSTAGFGFGPLPLPLIA